MCSDGSFPARAMVVAVRSRAQLSVSGRHNDWLYGFDPLLAIPAKVISPFLPPDFQYVGLWLGWCFFLQGWFGVRIVQELSPDPLIRILGGCCFILDPVLLWRIGHDSLCADWLLLGLIWLHLQPWPQGGHHNGRCDHVGVLSDQRWRPSVSCTMVWALALALVCKFHWVDRCLSHVNVALGGRLRRRDTECLRCFGVYRVGDFLGSTWIR